MIKIIKKKIQVRLQTTSHSKDSPTFKAQLFSPRNKNLTKLIRKLAIKKIIKDADEIDKRPETPL